MTFRSFPCTPRTSLGNTEASAVQLSVNSLLEVVQAAKVRTTGEVSTPTMLFASRDGFGLINSPELGGNIPDTGGNMGKRPEYFARLFGLMEELITKGVVDPDEPETHSLEQLPTVLAALEERKTTGEQVFVP